VFEINLFLFIFCVNDCIFIGFIVTNLFIILLGF